MNGLLIYIPMIGSLKQNEWVLMLRIITKPEVMRLKAFDDLMYNVMDLEARSDAEEGLGIVCKRCTRSSTIR